MLAADTDVLIDYLRGYQPASDWFSSLADLPVVPGFVVMELIQDAQNQRQISRTLKFLKPFEIVWPTASACESALAEFVAHHLTDGLGLLDSLIAATAIEKSATLCTFNTKHFRVVAELKTLQPYSQNTVA